MSWRSCCRTNRYPLLTQAYQKLLSEHKSLNCCLTLVHLLLLFGINAHMLVISSDLREESRLCIVFNPSGYAFFLASGLIIILTSAMSIRFASRPVFNIIFLEKVKKAYYVIALLSLLMVASLFASNLVCRVKRGLNSWPVFWSIFSLMESAILIIYIHWFANELNEIGAILLGVKTKQGSKKSVRNEQENELNESQNEINLNEVSISSVTTV